MSGIRCVSTALLALALALAPAPGCGRTAPTDSRHPQDLPMKPTDPTSSEHGGTAASTPANAAADISFNQEEPWRSANASFRARLDFAQPITQTESAMRAYGPDASYTNKKDWSKLVVDLSCSSDDRAPDAPARPGDGPLASLDAVQVFGPDRGKPLAVFSRTDLKLERGTANSFEHDGRGPIILTVERVRLPFAAQATLVRDGHPYRLTVVGLDGQGRTMVCNDIEGDEQDQAIAPQPLPQTGWAITERSSDLKDLKEKLDAQVLAAWAKLRTRQDPGSADAVTWSPQLSPALPASWPPSGDGKLLVEVYAIGQRPSLRDGAHVAAPWTRARISAAGEITLDAPTALKDLGIQGVKPMAASVSQTLANAESSMATIVRGRTMSSDPSVRDAYRAWLRANGVIAATVKARNPGFCAWLDGSGQP